MTEGEDQGLEEPQPSSVLGTLWREAKGVRIVEGPAARGIQEYTPCIFCGSGTGQPFSSGHDVTAFRPRGAEPRTAGTIDIEK